MSETAQIVLEICIAVGTVGAVIVALFGDFLRPRPKLTIEISDPLGYLTNAQSSSEDWSRPARYYHLQVTNRRRWVSANGVQVFLTHIQKLGPDGKYKTTWLGELPMRWRYQEHHPTQRIVGSKAECDLCCVVGSDFVQLQPLIYPGEFQHQWVSELDLILTLQARSVETDSQEIYVRLSWDGEWEAGESEMARHMIVERVKVREDGTVDV